MNYANSYTHACTTCNDTGLLSVYYDRRDDYGMMLTCPYDDGPDDPDEFIYCTCPAGVQLEHDESVMPPTRQPDPDCEFCHGTGWVEGVEDIEGTTDTMVTIYPCGCAQAHADIESDPEFQTHDNGEDDTLE